MRERGSHQGRTYLRFAVISVEAKSNFRSLSFRIKGSRLCVETSLCGENLIKRFTAEESGKREKREGMDREREKEKIYST